MSGRVCESTSPPKGSSQDHDVDEGVSNLIGTYDSNGRFLH